ncbi:MAG: YidC/Oxa1 family membrane protein insertase [Peptostreptococcaceae bacterium]|nr:YidC/Oxa1 family membrane protein insertase [Peptostreptococcaceae bacterium]
MDAISNLLGTLLHVIYNLVNNYGIAIILFTVVVRLALLPLTFKQTKSMKEMQVIQPKIKEIQEKYKNNKEVLNQKVMEVYQKHNVNPMAGCLPLLVQFPILIGLFRALRDPAKYVFGSPEVYASINSNFLWLENLSNPDLWILPILAAITTYLSSKMMQPKLKKGQKQDQTQMMMLYFFPLMMLVWGRSFPAGLTLYWVVGNLFQMTQQFFIGRPAKN